MERADLILRGGRIVTPAGIIEGDVAVAAGRILSVGEAPGRAAREIDAGGKWVMPGGVDPHAHIEQMSGMGLMCADTFETATRSAAMGGTTSVISFVAQGQGARLAPGVADYAARAARGAMIDHAFHLIVADTSVEAFDTDLAELIRAGHRSIKVFTTYRIRLDDAAILKVMDAAKADGALVCVHAENDALIARAKAALLAEGKTAPRFHAASHPRAAEIEAIGRMCRFAEHTGQPVMIFHVSTAEGAEVVRRAKARGVPVTAETCPHYLFMTEEVLSRPDGGKWMCSPPQRTAEDQAALWAALEDGTLDLVSSDHAPFRYDETGKLAAGPGAAFPDIANGLPGLETRLPLLFDAMVTKGRMGPEAFAQLTAGIPAALYGLDAKGAIAPGKDADLVIWDAEKSVTYGADDLHDNVGYNPWEGVTVTGWPETVLLRGEVIVEEGTCRAEPGQGRWIDRRHLPDALAP